MTVSSSGMAALTLFLSGSVYYFLTLVSLTYITFYYRHFSFQPWAQSFLG